MMSREEPAILYTVGCFEIDNQYVSLTNRVMKLVGANCVTLKKCGKFVEMILTRDFHDL